MNARTALASDQLAMTAEWATLNSELFDDHPLLSPDFVLPLVKHFAGPDVILARSNDSSQGRSLLLLRPRRAGFWSTFLPSQAPISPALPGPGADIDELLEDLPGMALGIDFLCQDPPYSRLTDGSHHATREQIRHLTTTTAEINTSFEDYWAARPKNLRRNVKRYFNRLAASGQSPLLKVHTDFAEARSALERYGMLESAGWKGAAGTAIHPENLQGLFYADVLAGFSRRNCFRVYELYFGDRLAASRLCILNASMLIVLKTTYDETLAHFAPGRVLLHMLLEREFESRGVSRIEFYTNANADSLSWATAWRDIFHVTHFRFQMMQRLVSASRPWRRALRDKLSAKRGTRIPQPDENDTD